MWVDILKQFQITTTVKLRISWSWTHGQRDQCGIRVYLFLPLPRTHSLVDANEPLFPRSGRAWWRWAQHSPSLMSRVFWMQLRWYPLCISPVIEYGVLSFCMLGICRWWSRGMEVRVVARWESRCVAAASSTKALNKHPDHRWWSDLKLLHMILVLDSGTCARESEP
jgi:hypothetical protein